MRPNRIVKGVIIAGVLMFGVIAISGTIDNFRFNRTVAHAREWLLTQGVASWHIDAGYVLNGWWLYAHPHNPPTDARSEPDVPFVTGTTQLPYKIGSSSEPLYHVVRSFSGRSLWAASNTIC